MVTKVQAILARPGQEFHVGDCKLEIGPRGGRKLHVCRCRVNGQCKVWVTRPEEFRLPIKAGIWTYDYITHRNNHMFHLPEDCPVERGEA